MILIEIKNIINELEEILIKDERFKDSYHFKNQVKIIYKKNNLNNNLNNNSNIDITPFISNLINLNKPPELAPISQELQESPIKLQESPIKLQESDTKLLKNIEVEDQCIELRTSINNLKKLII
jgi:hypothetical protein